MPILLYIFEGKASGEKFICKIDMSVAPFSNRFPSMGLFFFLSFTQCLSTFPMEIFFVILSGEEYFGENCFSFIVCSVTQRLHKCSQKEVPKGFGWWKFNGYYNVNSVVNMFRTQVNWMQCLTSSSATDMVVFVLCMWRYSLNYNLCFFSLAIYILQFYKFQLKLPDLTGEGQLRNSSAIFFFKLNKNYFIWKKTSRF